MSLYKQQSGFTLIELIITIVLGGIVAGMTTSVLTLPINAYIDVSRRATLTDVAESSLRRMQRDIRRALPNSIRITNGGKTLELLHLVDGGRYRAKQDGSTSTPSNLLDFSQADTSSEILGSLQNISNITLDSGINNDRLFIYPVNTDEIYTGNNSAVLSSSSTSTLLDFASTQFPLSSPNQRFFIVDMPITYHCDTLSHLLIRYEDYAIQASQVTPPNTPLDTGGALQANYLSACDFNYDDTGSSTRSGLVSLSLTFTDDVGESVRLIHQVHVDNQP